MLKTRAALVVALFFTLLPGTSAEAQSPSADIGLQLVSQPLWHEPGERLDLTLRVTNDSLSTLEGFIISVEGHQRVSSRSALHEAISGNAGFAASSFSDLSFRDDTVSAGTSRTITIDDDVSKLLALAQASEGGVYPVTLSLFDAQGNTQLDTLTTPLIYYPSPPEIPLGIVLAIPVNELPARGPDSVFQADPVTGRWLLEDGAGEGGWLSSLIESLQETLVPEPVPRPEPRKKKGGKSRREPRPPPIPPLHVSLAPSPRLIEELADMGNGYKRADDGEPRQVSRTDERARAAADALAGIGSLLRLPTVQPSLVPYSFPDLPTLEEEAALERGLSPQLREAHAVLLDTFGVDVSPRWLFAPAGRLDGATIEGIRAGSETFRHSFFTEESFEPPTEDPPPGCPEQSPSFTCPVRARTQPVPVTGLITDDAIQTRFARLAQEGDDRLDLQSFFAETAMIREEVPGITNRVIQATVPSLWHPTRSIYDLLFKGMRDAPWLTTLTPDEALRTSEQNGARILRPALDPLHEPGSELFTQIDEAQELVDSFELVRPPAGMIQRFRRNLLVAQSRLWEQDPALGGTAEAYVAETSRETQGELAKIRIGGVEEIRLTSQRGEIPIEIYNDASYRVNVLIHVLSTDLQIDRSIPQVLQPGQFQQLTVDIRARSSGVFPIEVGVETPDGSYEIDQKSITVRSTEFNRVALIITLGALGFLVFFFLMRGVRRRRGNPAGEPA